MFTKNIKKSDATHMRRMNIGLMGFVPIIYVLSVINAFGAEIQFFLAQKSSNLNVISISGALVKGDEDRFIDVALKNPSALVVLDSDGGNLITGLEIGKAIHLKGFPTLVSEGGRCASACALAWLAGRVRGMIDHSLIGFHAAYLGNTGEVASEGNAIVGAYLAQLGLPTSAIVYITRPKPSEMQWLTAEDAERYGIPVKIFPSKATQSPTISPPPPTPQPAQPAQLTPPQSISAPPSATPAASPPEASTEEAYLKVLYDEIGKHLPEDIMIKGEVTASFHVNSRGRIDSVVIDKTTSPVLARQVRLILASVIAPPPPHGSINVGQTFRFNK